MASTTYAEFNASTEGVEVAKAFADGIKGKTAIVTGVNRGGIGYAAAHALASQSPANLIVAGRSLERLNKSIVDLKADYPHVTYRPLVVDLSSQESVRAAAAEVLSWEDVPKIHTVINSAGVMGFPERQLAEEGIEMHLATNHIGHWLLACSIMPKLIAAAKDEPKGAVRIVNVSSGSPTVPGAAFRWSDINFEVKNKDLPEKQQPNYQMLSMWGYKNAEEESYIGLDGYNRSKVANVLFGVGANKRLFEKHGILVLAVHPGIIHTELGRHFPQSILDSVEEMFQKGLYQRKSLGAGSSTALVAALDPKLAQGVGESRNGLENWGAFLEDCQVSANVQPLAVSDAEAEKLWALSEKLVGEKFVW